MTSLERYKDTLRYLVGKYKAVNVLEIGVEEGVSTKVFLEKGCIVTSVDKEDCGRISKDDLWVFYLGDASEVLSKFRSWGKLYDLIYLDAFYTRKRLEKDVPLCWGMLMKGGALIFNEYIDFANHRKGEVRDFVHKWTFENNLDYHVYPNRNGFAVVEKK